MEEKMSQEKPVANGRFDGGCALVVEGPDGEEQTYYRNTNRTMYLEVRRLRASDNQRPVCGDACLFDLGNGAPGSPPQGWLCVQGRATLGGGSVSVIGAPRNEAHILNIEFAALDEDVYKRRQQEARGRDAGGPDALVTLGFVHHQQSAAGGADWFVVCELPPDALHALSSALLSGALHTITVGLALPEIYSDDWERPPAQMSWFLRPNHHDNKIARPPRVHGHVTHLDFDAASPARHRLFEEPDELRKFEVTDPGALSE
ncbi:MAG: hypothetical protein ABI135_09495 [Rhodoferax sp.]